MKQDGGSAFPIEGGQNNGWQPESGMSLRDWFAGMALQGMAAHESVGGMESIRGMAGVAYIVADAMLAEREKE